MKVESKKHQVIDANMLRLISFDKVSTKEIEQVCNGCGSSKAKFDFVPDTIYGLDVSLACYAHDWAYYIGGGTVARKCDDEDFHANLRYLISKGSWWLSGVRYIRAYWYYLAVRKLGASSFNFK